MPEVLNGYKWELYNIADDYSENNDLSAKYPDKLRELQELFLVEAQKYQVFPLDNSILSRLLTPRPSATAGRTEFTYSGEISGIPDGSAPSILDKSYSIKAEVEIPPGGAEGMLNTLGGRFGGYGLYLLKGKPVFSYNLSRSGTLPVGRSGGAHARQTHHSCLTSNTTVPASARAAPASCRLTAVKSLARRSRTPSRLL
jgi:hypothetical protein